MIVLFDNPDLGNCVILFTTNYEHDEAKYSAEYGTVADRLYQEIKTVWVYQDGGYKLDSANGRPEEWEVHQLTELQTRLTKLQHDCII